MVADYKLPAHFETWKQEIAAKAAEKAKAAGIEPKYLIAAMVLESGINPEADGDSGCSKGVLQVNECVNKSVRNTDDQIDLWIKNFKEEYEKTGSWESAAVDWNYPAIDGGWRSTRYWGLYKAKLNQVSI